MSKSITIKDIAQRAGVTASTVSRALNPNSPAKISEAVRAKIIQICDELQYRPNFTGRSIVTGKTYKIGMILRSMEKDLSSHDWARLTCGLSAYLQKHSYTLLLLHADNQNDKQNQQICEFLMSGVADGYITGPSMVTDSVQELLECLHVPLGVICESGQGSKVACQVQRDDMAAFGQVWQAIPPSLLSQMVYFNPGGADSDRRYREILHAGNLVGVPAEKYLTSLNFHSNSASSSMEFQEAFLAAEALSEQLAEKQFFWCNSDFFALGLIASLERHGRVIGKDAFVVGYGDLETYPGVSQHPILSTISAGASHLGELAGELLLNQIAGKEGKTIISQTNFIQRKSFPVL